MDEIIDLGVLPKGATIDLTKYPPGTIVRWWELPEPLPPIDIEFIVIPA